MPYGFTCVKWTPSPMRRPDHHNEIEINLLYSGWVTYLLGGRKITLHSGPLNAFWAGMPHQVLEYGQDTHYYVATIPLAWFLQCRLPESFVQPLLRGEILSEPLPGRGEGDLLLFSQWIKDLANPSKESSRVVMLEMQARLLRMAKAVPDTSVSTPGKVSKKNQTRHLRDGSLNKVEQMASFIAQRYTHPLTVELIGKAVGLHPNYAMSLFKKSFGTTLIDYLTHHRISHAQRLLATTDSKILDIAHESGFNSLSRFNEAFRRACHCTPRQYRASHEQEG